MATAGRPHGLIPTTKQMPENPFILIWLDDSADEDLNIKGALSSLFDNLFTFTDHEACLEFIESDENKTGSFSILISGRYGQMIVHDRLQPLNQVQHIYVFCYDIVKHSRWAQRCNKVQCVFSDITKILERMQLDIQHNLELQEPDGTEHADQQLGQEQNQEQQQQLQQQPQPQRAEIQQRQERERYTDDNNLLDQLALNLLFQSPDDGIKDFVIYCQTHDKKDDLEPHDDAAAAAANNDNPAIDERDIEELSTKYYTPGQPTGEWYQPNSVFTNINFNDFTTLWTLRWFIRSFHQQLTIEHENLIKDTTKFTVNYGAWLTNDELDAMKNRISEVIIITEFLLTHKNQQVVLDSMQNEEKNKHKVLFEININPNDRTTVPYAEIRKDQILLWFGARYQISKVQYIEGENEQQNSYWIIGLTLRSKLNTAPSIQNLYQYYLKELIGLNDTHRAFGRLLQYRGSYGQAENWLLKTKHYQELTELALRQGHFEQAKQYIQHLSEDSDETHLLNAYLHVLTSNDNLQKARLLFMRVVSEATDKYVRAQANIGLGFISLVMTQHNEIAFEYLTTANDVLRKILPDIHPILALSYIGIGYAYYSLHKTVEARKSFQTAFNIQKQSLIYNHPDFAKTRCGLAHCYSTDKQTMKKAAHEFDYALSMLLETFGRDHEQHPQIVATKSDIENLKKSKELRPRSTLLDYI